VEIEGMEENGIKPEDLKLSDKLAVERTVLAVDRTIAGRSGHSYGGHCSAVKKRKCAAIVTYRLYFGENSVV
jgi:hypothetical protein